MTLEFTVSDFTPRIAHIILFSIEIALYAILLLKIFGYKILNKKQFNAAGQAYKFATLSFLIYSILNVISVVHGDSLNIFSTIKTFVYLIALTFIIIHFYKVASFNSYGNSIRQATKKYKNEKKIKRATYTACCTIVYIQTVSVAVFSNSGSCLKYSDIALAFASLVFDGFLIHFMRKVDIKKSYAIPWLINAFSFAIFLVIRFLLDNLMFYDRNVFFIVNTLSFVFRSVSLVFYGYIAVNTKDLRLIYD